MFKQLVERFEPLLLFLFFLVFAGHLTPSVNEAHYLCKARHYWDPSWCPNDQFMCSADTHLAFYWVFGWLTQYFSLSATAWVGRFVCWGAVVYAWTRLSRALCDVRGFALITGALATSLAEITNLAGEWLVGGVEGKVFAWALVLLAARHVVRGEWIPVWPLVGIATAFHALVGGYSWLIYAAVFWIERPSAYGQESRITDQLPSVVVGIAAALVGIAPAVMMDWQVDPQIATEAHSIQVNERLPHHLKLTGMQWYRQLRFGALVAIWFGLSSGYHVPQDLRRLKLIVNGSLVVSGVGAIIELLNGCFDDALISWQRYYWFRMSDVWVPFGLVLFGATRVVQLTTTQSQARRKVVAVALIWLLFWVPCRFLYLRLDRRPHAVRQARPYRMRQSKRITARYRDWREVCDWIDAHTPTDATFLTPTNRQTFKWFANRGELATWKGMPQNATAIVEWKQRRLAVVDSGLYDTEAPLQLDIVRTLAQSYGLTHLLVERGQGHLNLFDFPVIYRNDHFELYRLEAVQAP